MSETGLSSIETVTPLQASLEVRQQTEALESARKAALKTIEEAQVNVSRLLETDAASDHAQRFMVMIGDETSPDVRQSISVIQAAAEQTRTPVLGDSQQEKQAFDLDEPAVQWGGWHNSREVRFSDPSGALRAKATEIQTEKNAPLQELADTIEAGENTAITTRQFSLADRESQDMVFSFMHSEPRGQTAISRGVHFMDNFVNGRRKLPVRFMEEGWPTAESGSGIYLNPDGSLAKIVTEAPKHPGVYHGMYFEEGTTDPTSASFHLGVEIDQARATREFGYNGNTAEPFIQSKTATEIISTITEKELKPTERLQALLAGSSGFVDRRYGNSYSEIGREIAKYVNDPSRDITRLFDGDAATIRQALAEIDTTALAAEPAQAVLSLLAESVNRAPDATADSTIPVYEGRIEMRDMSCKDVESAYRDDATYHRLALAKVGNTVMAIRTKGSQQSAINLSPVRYKGVELPAGSLFQVHQDQFIFVRPTAMQFNETAGKDAFTWQYHENNNHDGSSNEIVAMLLHDYQLQEERKALTRGYSPPVQPPAQS